MSKKSGTPFQLRVFPQGASAYGVALYEHRAQGDDEEPGFDKVVQVWGDPLRAIIDSVLGALRKCGYRPSELRPNREAPFDLQEEEAVRLGLLLLAVKPLRKHSRIDAITQRIREMETEEIYYWYSKSTSPTGGQRAQKALRILIAHE
jgi:hypothetical protein